MAKNLYTKQEVAFLKAYFRYNCNEWLSRQMKRPVRSLTTKAYELGLYKNPWDGRPVNGIGVKTLYANGVPRPSKKRYPNARPGNIFGKKKS